MPLSYKCFIPLFLTLGIVACGDSSNNAALDTLRCVVKSEKPLVMESSFNGVVTKTTVELRGGKMIQTVESNNPRVVDENGGYQQGGNVRELLRKIQENL